MEYINYNGKIIEGRKAGINISNRGFKYGDGLFETMKSKNGAIFFIDDHFDRLLMGMDLLHFKIPVHFSAAVLKKQITALLKKNGHNNLARIRLTVFRGDGGLYDQINHSPNYLLETWALPDRTGQWNSNGLVIGIYNEVKKSCDILSNLKHNNFLSYVMAALHAKKQKWNDAVVLNSFNRICDTTIANIFLVKDEKIYTPSLGEGCIAGVMRKNMIGQLAKNNIQVTECEISIADIENADEVFLTNSIYNLRWVKSIEGREYSNCYTRQIYSLLPQTISR